MQDTAMPAPDDIRFFADNGYWIAPRVFDDEMVASARVHGARVLAGQYDRNEAPQIIYPVSDPHKGLRKIDNAWWADSVFAAIVTSPAIGRIAAALLAVQEIYLWHDQLLWKPGNSEAFGNVGWHQDKAYWAASSSYLMITAWVAFDDVTSDMGAMRFVPGSHRWGKVGGMEFFETDLERTREQIAVPEGAQWCEVAAEMRAGQASFHHCMTLHASGPNTTARPRRAITIHLMAGDARVVRRHMHPNQFCFAGEDGDLWRGPRFPRLWPPAPAVERAAADPR